MPLQQPGFVYAGQSSHFHWLARRSPRRGRRLACQVVAARTEDRPVFALTRFDAAVFAAAQRRLVELSGIEPLASSLRTRRSPN